MSALGQKQTSRHLQVMSASPPKADIGTQSVHVRFVPKADMATNAFAWMFFISIGVYDLHCRHATGRKTVQAMTGIVSANMPDKDAGSSELHEATRGGEHIVIRRAKPKDKELYLDFLREVSAEDLRLRFFAHIRELTISSATWTTAMTWFLSRSTKAPARCSAWCV